MHFDNWIFILALATSDLILAIRVSALYGHSKIMRCFLVGFFACQIVTVIVIQSIILTQTTPILVVQLFPGCYAVTPELYYSFYIPFLIFDGVLLMLTAFQIFSYSRQNLNPVVKMLARDSIIYFALLFAALLVNVILATMPNGLVIRFPAECIACIAVSRMMMNMRGLAFDDPHGTEGINRSAMPLDTLNFVTQGTEDNGQFEV